MTTAGSSEPAGAGARSLVLHRFYRVGTDGELPDGMREAWEDLHARGFDTAMTSGAVGVDLPERCPTGTSNGSATLAARRSAHPGVYEAVAFRLHDAAGISVIVAPTVDVEWPVLDERAGVVEAGLGSVQIYQLLTHEAPPQGDAAVAGSLPQSRGWTAINWNGAPERVVVAEADDGGDVRQRRVGLLARRADERVMDEWTWAGAVHRPPAMTRYLLWAAKLRWETDVYLRDHDAVARQLAAVGEATNRLARLHTALDGANGSAVQRLIELEAALTALTTRELGLLTVRSNVRMIGRTATIATTNMTAAAGAQRTGDPSESITGILPRDRDIAEWVIGQSGDDDEYLSATYERSRDIAESVRARVAALLAEHQQRVTLLQTSVLGALLMALAAIQALEYRLPQLAAVKGPLVAVLAALALALPPAVLRGLLHDRRPRRWSWFEGAYLTSLGASVGWLAVTVTGLGISGALPPPWVSGPVVALAAVVAAALAVWRSRSSREPHE